MRLVVSLLVLVLVQPVSLLEVVLVLVLAQPHLDKLDLLPPDCLLILAMVGVEPMRLCVLLQQDLQDLRQGVLLPVLME